MSKLTLVAAATVALALSSPAAAATEFFENWDGTDFGAAPGFTILQNYAGWSNTTGAPGSGIEIQFNGIAGAPFSGENFVELDSNVNSVMAYDTALTAAVYTLSFYYSDRPNIGANSNGIDVLLNGVSIFAVAGGQGGNNTNWVLQSFNFSANDGDILSFAATGLSDSLGGYVDDVRLAAAVPEPATWAMLILGFGMVGATLRTRAKTRAALRFA